MGQSMDVPCAAARTVGPAIGPSVRRFESFQRRWLRWLMSHTAPGVFHMTDEALRPADRRQDEGEKSVVVQLVHVVRHAIQPASTHHLIECLRP